MPHGQKGNVVINSILAHENRFAQCQFVLQYLCEVTVLNLRSIATRPQQRVVHCGNVSGASVGGEQKDRVAEVNCSVPTAAKDGSRGSVSQARLRVDLGPPHVASSIGCLKSVSSIRYSSVSSGKKCTSSRTISDRLHLCTCLRIF